VKRLRQLEQENAKLKKLVAERDVEIDVMKEVAAKKCITRPVFARGVLWRVWLVGLSFLHSWMI
jgi:putative transposase